MPTRPHFVQIQMGPMIPLGRRGCKILASKDPSKPDGWADTPFSQCFSKAFGVERLKQFFVKYGEWIFSVLKSVSAPDRANHALMENETFHEVKTALKSMGVIREKHISTGVKEYLPNDGIGATFECLVSLALGTIFIEPLRDVKILYPYPSRKMDLDGQAYDVLGTLDISNLIWIEAKKPLYFHGASNPLGSILSPQKIKNFYQRALWLRPKLAVFLCDTNEDYIERIKEAFPSKFFDDGHILRLEDYVTQVVARVQGFMYFLRVKKNSPEEQFKSIVEGISQALHDARNDPPVIFPDYDVLNWKEEVSQSR